MHTIKLIDFVDLVSDSMRRDLTVNSIAQNLDTKEFIDPFNGMQDIKSKVLRHTTEAFKEDPLRVLRLARFAAKFPDFTIAPETTKMVQSMVKNGDLANLSPDRIWEETKKAMLTENPIKYIEALCMFDAFANLLVDPEEKWIVFDRDVKSQMIYLIERTKDLDDDNKLLLRAAFMYSAFAYAFKSSVEFVKALESKRLPKDIISFAEFMLVHNDTLLCTMMSITNIDKLVSSFDKMRLKARMQKNARFLDNVEIFCDALIHGTSFSNSHTEVRDAMEVYLDTQDHLSSWAKMYKLNNGEEPTGEEYAAKLKSIRRENLGLVQMRMMYMTSESFRQLFGPMTPWGRGLMINRYT